MLKKRTGQSTLEYALLISAVIVGLLAINTYMQRGVQGRLKDSVDDIGKPFDPSAGYESSWRTNSTGYTNTTEIRNTSAAAEGSITSNISISEIVNKEEYEAFGTTTPDDYYR